MVYITAIHMMSGGTAHEHIADVRWYDPDTKNINTSSRATMVDWIANKNGVAKVTDGKSAVEVRVVQGTPPYLRTRANNRWTDNLLALPRY
jgi:Protein of unknown function (DUF3892)